VQVRQVGNGKDFHLAMPGDATEARLRSDTI
ncbi:MAG: hypothetical protein JWO42_1375, partial [Chloroflexi bacterium]|nr:hypothetical protein [Chloroflexota bacterium]